MKRLLAIFALCSCCVNMVIAQVNYDTTKWTMMIRGTDTILIMKPTPAQTALVNGDMQAAVAGYRQQMKEGDYEQPTTYNIACAYAGLGNADSAFFFLKMALEWDSTIYALTDPDFVSLLTDIRWKEIEERQLSMNELSTGKRYKDRRLTKELLRMGLRDQAHYTPIRLAERKYGMKNPVKDSLWALKRQLNDENLARLKQIVDDNGWPRSGVVGTRAANAAFLIVQHSDLETQKKYMPAMLKAANEGNAEWDALALLIDRIEVSESRPQVYGSQVRYNEETGKHEPFPIVDEHNLDKRRKTVGLRPAKTYYANWDIDYTVQQNTE